VKRRRMDRFTGQVGAFSSASYRLNMSSDSGRRADRSPSPVPSHSVAISRDRPSAIFQSSASLWAVMSPWMDSIGSTNARTPNRIASGISHTYWMR
jgi:hypothetical protein